MPLFEPPNDPALLVQATTQGVSLNSVLSDLSGPMPNYCFQYLLHRAPGLTSEVKYFGHALHAAREKQHSETYAVLRARHETSTHNAVMEMKKLALEEANSNLEALVYSHQNPRVLCGTIFN